MNGNGLAPWVFSENAGAVPIKMIKCMNDAELYEHWPWLEARLKVVKKKDKTPEQWTPAHIREAIRQGFVGRSSCELWLGVNPEGVIEGFILTTLRFDAFVNLPIAWTIWVIWANEALIERAMKQMTEIARSRFMPAIEFTTGREGWLKKAPRLGFKLSVMNFRKEL
jgi:hypothetical protein